MADDAAPAVFKKPARKANMRKRKVEVDADAPREEEAAEASGGPRCADSPARTHTHTLRQYPPGTQGHTCHVAVRRSR
eukprot:scaffold22727_cov58-Phaeocystis_antarctica.AAC.8